ncbi:MULTISPECIES: hydrogen peroxide-inducible genes activator [Hyphomonas]|uniref:Hydrogen peroxide-inducible genes activator n=2 Tax=Hyphomonas adhaerens TaxID=81029 RepID=A0A3B9GYG0_9PROT|nr:MULTISPECIES: hydrogen peroxide-inducible genes activator [Hyphomonas]KCZ84442.1 putative oxidative stress regulatory protein OxyR [Hyphomonas adhaerens MHS-3]MBB38890.1 hydrogen peroxide-inducible genes activator [Hyphomonas sp.]HAE27470.1 hydrogen peroxide-inducible genes activator [Hyphomonas adhaerens]|tara:strand:+ start:260 stop:1168 length:909 start_codon:yes stop_codon:yes gene_type:complete
MIIPTLRQLQFLVALGESGSFSRAAEACHVTQPTLSAGIRELEDLLGVKLAEREARGASLTHAGEIALARASALLNDAHALVQAVQSAGAMLTGPFHLGAIPTIAPFVLPQTVSALNTAYPDLKLYLHEDKTGRLIDQLRTRTLDAALIALPWDTPGIESMTLMDDEFLFAAPANHPLAKKNGLTPEDLVDENLLLLEDGHCLRDHALSICRMRTGARKDQVAATSLGTLVNMIAGGLGVSLLPKLAVDHGLNVGSDVAVREFVRPVIGRRIGIAWRAGSPREADARKVGEVIKEQLTGSSG